MIAACFFFYSYTTMEAVAAALSVEYEKVKENLKGVDENIIKLYGRDPNENRLVSSSIIIYLSWLYFLWLCVEVTKEITN